jgi:hypothetical protein
MNRFRSLVIFSLIAPAVTLGMGSALAQEAQVKPDTATEQEPGPTEREKGPHVIEVPTAERTAAETEADQRAQQERSDQDTKQAQGESQQPVKDTHMAQGSTPAPRATPTPYLTNMPADSFRVDQLIGTSLKSRTDDGTIGSISDLVIDEDGQIVAVIVEVGGFLGIGQKHVAIPWYSMERTMNDEDDEYELHINASKEALTDAPEYKTEAKR